MRRIAAPDAGAGFAAHARRLGIPEHHDDGQRWLVPEYGIEVARADIDVLYDAAAELERICLEAVHRIVNEDLFDRFELSPLAARLVADSWDRQARNLVGRFDLAWVPGEAPRLVEYNAETAVALVEAARWQVAWKDAYFPQALQFAEIKPMLVDAWRNFGLPRLPVHFAGTPGDAEAALTLDFLAETARASGLEAARLDLDAVGWDGEKFVDADDRPIRTLAKLYPWAWLVEDEFGPNIEASGLTVVEPAWKMLLADKRMLALLWEMFPAHPNLLPASLDAGAVAGPAVAKPALGRDGAGVKLHAQGLGAPATGGDTDDPDPRDGPPVHQALAPLARVEGAFVLPSVWMVASRPAGLALREADTAFVGPTARFLPHIVG